MRTKLIHWLFPSALLLVLAISTVAPVHAQVAQAASQQGVPLVIGGGYSNFATDYGPAGTRMSAIAAWADYYLQDIAPKISGLGIEIEGRDLNYGAPFRLRQTTGMGGVIYEWSHYYRVRPYGKFIAGIGSIDFPKEGTIAHPYSHDTFLVTAPAGGVDIRVAPHVWVRAEYQFQQWHQTFGPNDLTPNGVTVGATWDFRTPRQPVGP
jgi:opacity protein-like surface antigen